jgi:hypothetical protein
MIFTPVPGDKNYCLRKLSEDKLAKRPRLTQSREERKKRTRKNNNGKPVTNKKTNVPLTENTIS